MNNKQITQNNSNLKNLMNGKLSYILQVKHNKTTAGA